MVIYGANSPVAKCRHCGVQKQFHSDTGITHARERGHPFEVMTLADLEPGDMDAEQLVATLAREHEGARAAECRSELRALVAKKLGIDWDELRDALAPDLLGALHQYVSDLRYPPTGDSVQRRIDRAESVIAMVDGK